MLEIRKGTATRNYENTFFREFANNLKMMFNKYSVDGLLIGFSECEFESRLQIDALLITPKVVIIIDFKNFGGKITLPKNGKSEFDFGVWLNENGEPIKGGSFINPFQQLIRQKERFIKVVEKNIIINLPIYQSSFNSFHTVRAVCFQKPIELIGKIPSNEELNFFIFDKSNYLETIKAIIDIYDKEVTLTKESYVLFKEVFKADLFDTSEKYDNANDFTSYNTELDFENLYPDQKSALNEIENFIKSEDEKIFILQGTSLSGKTHLIPFIQDIAFNNQIKEVKLFASSSRISNNLLKSSNLEFESIYSYIYGGNSTAVNEKENDEEENENSLNLEIVPLLKSDNTEEAIFIVDESHLISDNYHQSVDLRFGSGKLLKDFLEFADLKNSKRKIVFIGDSFQLSLGKKEESSLNPDYLNEEYGFKNKAFQLIDKENKSIIVAEALKAVNCIRQQSFNNLAFDFSENIRTLLKEDLKEEIEKSLNTNSNSHILCYSNSDAQKVNYWIKNSILKNGNELTKDDFVFFGNNIRVEDENDPFAEPKKIFNGQFGTVLSVSDLITKDVKLITPLYFRKIQIQLKETNHILSFLSFENFRLSDKGEFSKEEIISFNILLNQLTEKEIPNFKNGKYQADEEIKSLIDKYETAKKEGKKNTGITKLTKALQKQLRNIPSSEYYKFKNSAQLRFGWALTVHKSMSYKWNEIYFNVETGGGKTNENYFKWIYTGLIRATQKVSLINYEPISPFDNTEIRDKNTGVRPQDIFFHSDNGDISERISELTLFLKGKLSNQRISIITVDTSVAWQVRYSIKNEETNQECLIYLSYNAGGNFKIPANPILRGDINLATLILELLKTKIGKTDFSDIKDAWRKKEYEKLKNALSFFEIKFELILQTNWKDKIRFFSNESELEIELDYGGDGMISYITAKYYSDEIIWKNFKKAVEQL